MSGAGAGGVAADPSPGPVELSEEAPLKAGGGGGPRCGGGGGPRLIVACFAALTAAITLALFTQIYYNDYEVVPHGGVSCDAAACALAGTDALKAGGRALDAAAAAALCLALLAPHRTSLDASGSLLYWEYRAGGGPLLAEWGPAAAGRAGGPPRLLAALAALHARHGALPWRDVLQPTIALARSGFPVSASLATALATAPADASDLPGAVAAGARASAPRLAAYLEALQRNTSAELSAAWGGGGVRVSAAVEGALGGGGRVFAGGARAGAVRRALRAALQPPPASLDEAEARATAALLAEGGEAPAGVATGLAVVDGRDAYAALVTGTSVPFGTGPGADGGAWRRDAAASAPDLAPAMLADGRVCGARWVLGAAGSAALTAAAATLAAGGGPAGVERARPAAAAGAVNVVQQTGDALLSHADSRGGGLASRF